jgi:hypothetical protein
MCRSFLILDMKNREDEAKFQITICYIYNASQTNNDGYYLRVDNKVIRTLDVKKYMNFAIKNRVAINKAKVISGHLRIATAGGKEEKWIHGWDFNGYECHHNGILSEYDKHDSYEFFEGLKTFGVNTITTKLKKTKGNGAFFMVDVKGNKFIGSRTHRVNIHYINEHLLVFNSNDDIHSFYKGLKLKGKSSTKSHKIGVLEFEEDIPYVLSFGNNINSDVSTTLWNEVLQLDNTNKPILVKEYGTGGDRN